MPHSKVDTTDQEKRLKNAILKAVINGHITAVERALQTLEEDCVLPAVQAGKQLLDFLPENALRVMVCKSLSCFFFCSLDSILTFYYVETCARRFQVSLSTNDRL